MITKLRSQTKLEALQNINKNINPQKTEKALGTRNKTEEIKKKRKYSSTFQELTNRNGRQTTGRTAASTNYYLQTTDSVRAIVPAISVSHLSGRAIISDFTSYLFNRLSDSEFIILNQPTVLYSYSSLEVERITENGYR